MAASICAVLGRRVTKSNIFRHDNLPESMCFLCRNASWTSFFKRDKGELEDVKMKTRKMKVDDGPTTLSRLESVKKKTSVNTVRGYTPPANVDEKVMSIASSIVGGSVDHGYRLDDRLIKFKVLTKLMKEFDHTIPNTELSLMNSVDDVINFFSTPVRDRSSFEDLAKLDLPKNLHIQMEPVRFDPETDTFFGGQTAFANRPTVVSSLKYSRKFKGNSGDSRNQRSLTNFEFQKELEELEDKRSNR